MNLNLICPGTWRLIASSAVFQLPSFFSAILLPCCIMAVVRITLSCLAETSALRQSGTCVVLEGHCLLWAKLINKLIIAAWLASSSALLRSGESSDRAVVCAERARAECQEGKQCLERCLATVTEMQTQRRVTRPFLSCERTETRSGNSEMVSSVRSWAAILLEALVCSIKSSN